jgi:hypothetical protein
MPNQAPNPNGDNGQRMVAAAEPDLKAGARKLWHKAKELHLIFASIWRKS